MMQTAFEKLFSRFREKHTFNSRAEKKQVSDNIASTNQECYDHVAIILCLFSLHIFVSEGL